MEDVLRLAMIRRLKWQSTVKGEIVLPAAPAMVDEYVTMCDDVFATFGARFNDEELAGLRGVLEEQLAAAYAGSQRSEIVISYERFPMQALNYHVYARWFTIEATYDHWVATREPPLFGTEADARVLALAAELGDPADAAVLDVGAGTGRNSLALARRGHPVDAVEVTERFAEIITGQAEPENLDVRVLRREAFATVDDLRRDYRLMLLSEVVSDFRSTADLRLMFELAEVCLAPGGYLLFNAFIARDGYTPDDAARELGQQFYTAIFTASEIAEAASAHSLYQVADDCVHDYEQTNLPTENWPPTSWYANWVSGMDVFDLPREDCPVQMRWLTYRKYS